MASTEAGAVTLSDDQMEKLVTAVAAKMAPLIMEKRISLPAPVDQSGMSAAYERRAGVMASVLGLSVGMAQWLGREVRGRKV